MTTTKTFYIVEVPNSTLSKTQFETHSEAIDHIVEHQEGMPKNERMTHENREYWKEIGNQMVLHRVVRTDEVTSLIVPRLNHPSNK